MQDTNNSGVYRIYCPVSGKTYVGLSKTLKKRQIHHFSQLKNNRHNNSYLQRHYNKYGRDSLVFEIIELCEYDKLREREVFYIQKYDSFNNGFNLSLGGEDNPMNHERNRIAVSVALKGHVKSKEWIDKILASRDYDKAFKTKIENGTVKMVYAYSSKSGELILKMNGYKKMAQHLNINDSNIRQIITGKMKSCKGYHFSLFFKYFDQVKADVISEVKSVSYREAMSIRNSGSGNPMWGKRRTGNSGVNHYMYKKKIAGTIVPIRKFNHAQIIELYKSGNTQNCISKITGAKQGTISAILRQNGIQKFYRRKAERALFFS